MSSYAIATSISHQNVWKVIKDQYVLCQNMPTNLYGPTDTMIQELPLSTTPGNWSERSMRGEEISNSPSVVIWETGYAYSNSFMWWPCWWCYSLIQNSWWNQAFVGHCSGEDIAIKRPCSFDKKVQSVMRRRQPVHDLSKPDGTPCKLMDVSNSTDLIGKRAPEIVAIS